MKFRWGALAAAGAMLAISGGAAAQSDAESEEARIVAKCGDPDVAAASREEKLASVSCYQREAAAQVKSTLPRKVDSITTVTDLTVNGTILTYHYKVDLLRSEIPADGVSATISDTRTFVCANEDMAATIAYGGGYRYLWTDRNGEYIAELTIDRC